jgi:outer membrane receptor protein involved in Fe transport
MPRFTLVSYAAAVFLLAPCSAVAEEREPLSPIVVTGRGLGDTPATPAYRSSEIGREQIEASASGRIEDVLLSVAGFQQFRRSDSRSASPSAQGVTLRALGGNATSRALVLLDGVPMAHPFFGYIPLSAIAPERLESVRVTHGGGSGAFGAGAVSGTIELESAGPERLGPWSASAMANQRGESEVSALAAPRLGAGYAVASLRWDRGPGFHTTPRDQRVAATSRARFDGWSAALRAVTPLDAQTELQVGGLLFDDERTLRFKGARSTSSGQDASLRIVHRGTWQVDALGYVQARDFSNVVISSSRFTPTLDQRATPSTGLGGKLELRPPVGENMTVRIGADLRVAKGRMEEEAFNAVSGARTAIRTAGGQTQDIGLYGEADAMVGDLVLTAGARADRWSVSGGHFTAQDGAGALVSSQRFADRSGWQASFRGGALWRAGGGLSLRAAAYTGLRQPTLNELYRPFVVFPVETRANAELGNEKLEGFEAGVDYARGEALLLSLTAFDNRLKNAIANVTVGPNLRERRNVEAIRARGIEAAARISTGQWSLDGSLAWTDAEVRGSGPAAALNGKRPAQVPRLAASATLGWQPQEGWRIAATLRHVGRQFEDDLETDALPAATTLDAYAEAPLAGTLALVLRGENLTNERVVTRNQGGSIDLGAPRTLWIGLKLRGGR